MLMNIELLKEKIEASNIKKRAFKDALGVTYYTFNRKINGDSNFSINEMNILARMLKLTDKEKVRIFFGKQGC